MAAVAVAVAALAAVVWRFAAPTYRAERSVSVPPETTASAASSRNWWQSRYDPGQVSKLPTTDEAEKLLRRWQSLRGSLKGHAETAAANGWFWKYQLRDLTASRFY